MATKTITISKPFMEDLATHKKEFRWQRNKRLQT